jgi:NADPH2:quinone reductase
MKAYVLQSLEPSAPFNELEVTAPRAGAGRVVVKVAATSVNPLDVKIRRGVLAAFAPPMPAILHGDLAGVITELGEGVRGLAVGDEVFGFIGGVGGGQAAGSPGALADFAEVDARLLARKPRALSMAQAAALPLVGITAWEALVDRIAVKPGDHVLVHAGTGGVGHVAIQLAKLLGARVATTVSSEAKAEIARSLGADDIIYYRTEEAAAYVARLTGGLGFDAVFDTVGGRTLDDSLAAARVGGQVATISAYSSHSLAPAYLKGLTLHVVLMLIPVLHDQGREHHGEIMRRLGELADRGRLKPLIDDAKFTFAQASAAHERLESGETIGKIVLTR